MSLLETVGIMWVLLTSIAGHILFASLAWIGARTIIEYVHGLENNQQAHKPEVIRRMGGE
jgi:hypothetical protein